MASKLMRRGKSLMRPGLNELSAGSVSSTRLLEKNYHERGMAAEMLSSKKKAVYQRCRIINSYACFLRWCGNAKALAEGKRAHASIMESGYGHDRFLGNLLVEMYGKCGALEDARSVFANMRKRNVFTWTMMIVAYVRTGQCKEAFSLLEQMRLEGITPDKVTFVSVLSMCASHAVLGEAKCVHRYIVDFGFGSDVIVGTALVTMYAKYGCLDDARQIFDKMPERTVVSWNAVIAAHAQHGHKEEALRLLQQMQLEGMIPNRNTFVSILSGFASQTSLVEVQQIHACIADRGFESDVFVGTALVRTYGKCGSLENARRTFDSMPKRNVVSWTIMIAAYAKHKSGMEALEVFKQMQLEGVVPDKVTFVCVLDACANQAALAEGKQLHSRIVDWGFDSDVNVGNALVNMYGKCGSLNDARSMFDGMPMHNVVSWNALIAAYAQHGQGNEALELVQQMLLEHMTPNKVTFVSILSACRYACLVDKGICSFVSMTRDHGIAPTVEHYHCMADLLGWMGLLDEVEELINNMPCQATIISWMGLLGACRMHSDVERGERAVEPIFELDPDNTAAHVAVCNVYRIAGRQDDAATVRRRMED